MRRLLLLLLILALPSCGDELAGTHGEAPPKAWSGLPSPVVRSERPRGTFGGLAGVTSFDATSTSNEVTLTPMTGAPETSVEINGTGVILALARLIKSKPHLLLGVNDEQDVFLLQVLHDADGDNTVDPQTLKTCFTTAPDPAFFVYAGVVGDTWYFLDARHQDIRVARDTTGDGLPDTLVAEPFARSADYGYLRRARSIGTHRRGLLLVSHCDLAAVPGAESGYATYEDTDGDDRADREVLHPRR